MEMIKEFVVTLVSTLVLITAVEMILPDNKMKKYSKFILGLMLIGVILNPVIKFFSSGEETIEKKIEEYSSIEYSKDEKEKINAKEIQLQNFKENISKNINNILKDKYKGKDFSNEVECTIDLDNMNVAIDKVIVYVDEKEKVKTVEKIKKIRIGENGKETEVKTNKEYEEIREFLSDELNLDKVKIKVLKKEE